MQCGWSDIPVTDPKRCTMVLLSFGGDDGGGGEPNHKDGWNSLLNVTTARDANTNISSTGCIIANMSPQPGLCLPLP